MANLPDRVPARELRASDADRERVAAILRQAAAEGRLQLDEADERLAAVYAARTYADLEPITRDLPDAVVVSTSKPGGVERITDGPTSRGAVAVLGGFSRRGPWVVPRRFTCLAFWGGGVLDLREARFAGREVKIRAIAIMGGIQVTVPEDAEVHVTGTGVMGGFEHRASGAGAPGAPRIIVTGFAFWGGVDVRRRPPEDELKRRKQERKQQKLERKRDDG